MYICECCERRISEIYCNNNLVYLIHYTFEPEPCAEFNARMIIIYDGFSINFY